MSALGTPWTNFAIPFSSGPHSVSKGEKERYKHLNAEFQRIAWRDKKAFLSDQSKEIEENNRMGKTRELFKKITGNISCKGGLDKGQIWSGPNRSRRY